MENEKGKCNQIDIDKQIISINNKKKEESNTFNRNTPHKKKNYKLNTEILSLKHNNTICYSKSKYFNFFSSFYNKNKNLKKSRKIGKNKTELVSDKIIQTPAAFYKNNKSFVNKSHFIQKAIIKLDIKNSIYPNKIFLKNINKGKNYSINNRSINFYKLYIGDKLKKKNQKFTRNKLNPILNLENERISKINKSRSHLTNYYIPNNAYERRNHKNLLNMENIYFQSRKNLNNFMPNMSMQNYKGINKYKLLPSNKKLTIKKLKSIKYPSSDNKYLNIKIINENNEHMLEKLYKQQTVSNFNNKYQLKYKTNDTSKKENMKHLFFLLKKFKYSEKEKKNIFSNYSKIKKKKIFRI